MADEELQIKITVVGSDKAKKSMDDLSDSSKKLATSSSKLSDAFMKMVPGGNAVVGKLKDIGELAEQVGLKMGMSAESAAGLSSTIAGLGPAAVAAAAALAVVTAAVITVAKAIKLIADTAPLETIQVGFNLTAARAGAMGDEVLAAMQKASGGMISMQALMTNFNDAAQLVSPQFAIDLTNVLEPLQKVSMTTGRSMEYLMNSYIIGIGRLSPRIIDNLGVTVSLEEANQRYARSIGKTAEQLTKQEQQMALATLTIERLRANTDAIPLSMNNANAIMLQMRAGVDNLKASFGMGLLPVLTEILRLYGGPAKEIMKELSVGLQTVGNVLRNTFNKPEVRKALDELAASMTNLFGQGTQIAMKAIIAGIYGFAQVWSRLSPSILRDITSIFNALTGLAMVVNRVLDALNKLGIIKTTASDLSMNAMIENVMSQPGPGHSGGTLAYYASGTNYHPGGLAMVGEKGPELVQLPRGSKVYPNGQGGSAGGFKSYGTVNIYANNDTTLASLLKQWEAAATATT